MNLNPFDSNNNNKAKQCSGIKIRGIFSHDYKQAMNEKAMQFFEILLNSCHLHTSLYIYIYNTIYRSVVRIAKQTLEISETQFNLK